MLFWIVFLPALACSSAVLGNRTDLPFFHGHVFENSSPSSRVNGLSVPVKRLNSQRLCAAEETGALQTTVHFKLLGNGSDKFRVLAHHKRGHILLKTSEVLDREERAEYTLDVGLCCGLCAEENEAEFPVVASIKVDVLDTNDHQPAFTTEDVKLSLDDATALRSSVYALTARDGDSGKNAEMIYFVVPKNGSFYAVPKTGDILLVDSILGLDEPIKFEVFARDRGWPPRTSRSVLVQSDEPLLINVSEDAGIGSVVMNLNPVRFQTAAFELVEPDLESTPVSVSRDTGDIIISRRLDRETEPLVEISVKVQDKRGKKRRGVTCGAPGSPVLRVRLGRRLIE
ncbi:hypothetical protein WMY93_013408 [Mugilogobius chulae]|uniref:Cadherin domain-containing protein n=1 Tax=Mugilogobius chulae TaxID=88201 RepID=A0AAW0P3W6_9GOBI